MAFIKWNDFREKNLLHKMGWLPLKGTASKHLYWETKSNGVKKIWKKCLTKSGPRRTIELID